MSNSASELEPMICDASSIINVCCSGVLRNILDALNGLIVASDVIADNPLWTEYEPLTNARQSIDLDPLIQAGMLKVVNMDMNSESEAESYLHLLTENLNENEAVTASIAINRQWILAVDDRRVRSVMKRISPTTTLWSTPELVKQWCDVANPHMSEIQDALSNIMNIGSYKPSESHPLFNWWYSSLND